MSITTEELARSYRAQTLGQATQRRLGQELTRVHRANRRAEQAARRARLALARAL